MVLFVNLVEKILFPQLKQVFVYESSKQIFFQIYVWLLKCPVPPLQDFFSNFERGFEYYKTSYLKVSQWWKCKLQILSFFWMKRKN